MRSIDCAGIFLLVAPLGLFLGCNEAADGTAGSGTGGSMTGGSSSAAGGSMSSGGAGSGGASGTAGGTTGTTAGGTTGNATGGAAGGASGKATGGATGATTGGTTGAAGGSAGGSAGSGAGGTTGRTTGGTTGTVTGGATGGAKSSTGGATGNGTGGTTGRSTGGTTGTTAGGTTGNGTGGTTGGSGGSTGTTVGYPLGNPAVPSPGCGKALSTFKSGTNTYKMTSAGLNREYIVALPDQYDTKTPHRLIFGMHWMNGSAEAVEGWSKWFGLKALDTTNSTVFVAPNGYGSSPLWNQGVKDHTFFDDMVKLLESDLCIDTSRIFSVGFSFGAMFTNSLAQTHQDVLRGVVLYAAADFNIYFPANTGKPLGYMGVHGLKDPTCPIASGRSSRDRFVKNNGCTVPGTVPEAKSGGNYVTYDYQCPSNYPVRWVTFDGKHTYPPNDTGTWVYGSTWEFISQF